MWAFPLVVVSIQNPTIMTNLKFETEFTKRHPERAHLIKFMREAIGKDEVEWSDLTKVNLLNVCDHFKNNMAANSARTYFATLCGFLNLYSEEGLVPCNRPNDVLKVKKDPTENVVLSEDEIALIEAYNPKTEAEKHIKAQFLCEYYSLARQSDVLAMTDDNIRDGYISYISKKTHVLTKVPLHRNFITYLHQKGKAYHRASYDRVIKNICKEVGINKQIKLMYRGKEMTEPKYKFIASHTARRSAATTLAKRNVPITTISKLMGHKSIVQTYTYIITDIEDLDQSVMSFFG